MYEGTNKKKVNKIEKKKVRIVFTIAKQHPTLITKQETNARDKKNRLKQTTFASVCSK